jgi:hypothetical protein
MEKTRIMQINKTEYQHIMLCLTFSQKELTKRFGIMGAKAVKFV